ncbi:MULTISPECIES: hypothetical protein [Streptomyces]|uniref:hypothetical protein n=1 Tax=Streptomyces TaxID=1883 RepID=UPI0029A76685|nr:hypothetical protein [Streptomyces sp. WI03-4A]MDX2591376.1 hypothetical protein [Streptomyces sp. WI03-4A]
MPAERIGELLIQLVEVVIQIRHSREPESADTAPRDVPGRRQGAEGAVARLEPAPFSAEGVEAFVPRSVG